VPFVAYHEGAKGTKFEPNMIGERFLTPERSSLNFVRAAPDSEERFLPLVEMTTTELTL